MDSQDNIDFQDALVVALDTRRQLESKLNDIAQIIEVNNTIVELVETSLKDIKEKILNLGKGGGISSQIDNIIQQLSNIPNNEEVLLGKSRMREQVLVLFVSAFETYLCELIRGIANCEPSKFKFSDKKEKISFDQQLLKDDFTLGDALLEHMISKGANFQDLKSTIETLKNYLDMQIELSHEDRDILILSASMRHVIIHNSSMVNRKFLNQVRDTAFNDTYKKADTITVEPELVSDLKTAILGFADQLVSMIAAIQ